MDIVVYLITSLVALGIGFFLGKWFAPDEKKVKALEAMLAEKEKQHDVYREQVAGHFSDTAKQFNNMTSQYRELYDHLSEGAQTLCERRSIPRELSTAHVDILAVESPASSPELASGKAELSEPSVVDVSKEGLSPISSVNQAILEQHKEVENSAEVIDIQSQRQEVAENDDVAPAKDYAIKEKGVINHNSLNRDDVNT